MTATQNTLLPSSQKSYPKSFEKVLEKCFNFSKVARKIEERHRFTLNFACKLDILSI